MKQSEYFNLLCTELLAEEKVHKILISNMGGVTKGMLGEERIYD